jgi:hypothetical protein
LQGTFFVVARCLADLVSMVTLPEVSVAGFRMGSEVR